MFDGHIPTLTGLDGDTWASQLLLLRTTPTEKVGITIDFRGTPEYDGLNRLDVVTFNCPEWGTGVQPPANTLRKCV